MRILLLIAACAVQLSAQNGITFSLSIVKEKAPEPGWKVSGTTDYLLTVKKSDPRAVDMFSFEVVDADGKFYGRFVHIDENRIAPAIPADATEWTMHPFLGYMPTDTVVSVRNPKVVFAGDDNPIVKKRNEAIKAGRTFRVLEAEGEERMKNQQ